jgi:hypothetical protein
MTNSPANPGVSDATIEAFHMMWDNFPHGVLLLNKSRDIVAINKRAEERGVRTGRKCFQLTGNTEIHRGCKADQALAEAMAQRVITNNKKSNRLIDTYWLPIPADKDLYLHFAIETDLSQKT